MIYGKITLEDWRTACVEGEEPESSFESYNLRLFFFGTLYNRDTLQATPDDTNAKLAADDLKSDVQKAGKKVKEQIESTAPKDTGKYAKSWAVKKTKETSDSIQVVVHSKNRYQLTHLLEFGHAKRGGGRVAARPHIAAAEAAGMEQLTRDIERDLRKGG